MNIDFDPSISLTNKTGYLRDALASIDCALIILSAARRDNSITEANYNYFSKMMQIAIDSLTKLGVYNRIGDYLNTLIDEINGYEVEAEHNFSDEDIDQMVDDLSWEDIADLYPSEDLVEVDDGESEDVNEAISTQSRIKKSQLLTRNKAKLGLARKLKLKRASSTEVLKKRAIVAARRAVYKRLLMGRSKASMSPAERDRIEKQVSKMKYLQAAIAIKMLPKIRAIEQKRLAPKKVKITKRR